ncbi:MAG TPA: peptidylprolyl isomerase [Minicystis sp.]|nr:peptidylprolyl isomerase [Minicystis sp.]
MNKLSQLLGGAAVIAIAVVFILQFRPATGASVKDDGPACLAEVHGTCIPTHVFQAAFRMLTMRMNDGNALRAMRMREQTAEGLIEAQLLVDDAKRLGLAVTDDDVSREFVAGRVHVSLPAKEYDLAPRLYLADPRDWIQLLPVKGKSKKFEPKQFEKVVRQYSRLSPTDFREWQKKELLAARMRDLVKERVRISEDEAFEQFVRDSSKATIDYANFDLRWYFQVIDTSQKKIDAWAEKNKELIDKTWEARKNNYLPECRVTRHILVKVDMTTASEQEKAAAKKRIEAALDRVKKGEDFGQVAKDVSEDSSASDGGLLGCVQKNQMVKPFEDAMLKLDSGQVSGVVQTQFGYHIVKVDQVAKGPEAEKVGRAQTTKELYLKTEASRMAAEAAKEVLGAVQGGKSLKDALDAYLAHVLPKADESKDKKADKAGGETKKKNKDQKGDKHAAKDKEKDKADASDKGAADATEHAPQTAANSPLRPQIDTSLPFTINGHPVPGVQGPNDVAKVAFDLKKVGDADAVSYDGGFLVIQLKDKTPATKEDFEKNREQYVGAMRAYKQQDALIAYVKRLSASLGPEARPKPALVAEPKPSPDEQQEAPAPMPDDGE